MGKAFIFGMVLFCTVLQSTASYAVYGRNVTAEYRATNGALDLRSLQGTRVLFVTGILADAVLALGGEYFDAQVQWASRSGLDYYRIPLRSEGPMDENAQRIAEFIRSSEKPVTIIAHSKGALETLDALVKDPALRPKVKGFVSIQSPYLGSPVAEFISDIPFLMLPTNWFFRTILNGTGQSLEELGISFRSLWMARHQSEIPAVLKAVPIISVATWKDPALFPWQIDTLLKPTRDAILLLGMHNDGVVPWESAVLPGSEYVALPGVDHASTVSRNPVIRFDQVDFTKRLLEMVRVRTQKPRLLP